jgi:uncharacterized protein
MRAGVSTAKRSRCNPASDWTWKHLAACCVRLRMTTATLLLLLAVLAGLLLIPFGLPGIWLMLLAGVAHRMFAMPTAISWITLVVLLLIAVAAEWLEFSISGKYTQKYGGSRRAAWGAILGGFAGAMVGVPVPIIGSVIGAFAGSFAGALVAEYTLERNRETATRAATGALIGRAVATGMKAVAGCVIGGWLVAAAWG